MPPKKRTTSFHPDHIIAHGLKICERDIYAGDIGVMPVLPALRSGIEGTLRDLGSFVITAIGKISVDEMAVVVKSNETCSVNLIAGLTNIVAERDSANHAAESMPPVLPHQLVKLRGREFANNILQQKIACLFFAA
jgi:hypothetical protein